MTKQVFFAAALLLAVSSLFAQRKADWTTDLPAEASQIFFHSLTGVPIIKSDKTYSGIDVQSHTVKWTVERSGMQSLAAVTGNDEGQDFFEVANSPYAVINETLLDTRDGKILLSKDKDGYKKLVDYEMMPDIDGILFKTFSADFVRLHLIDKKTGTKKWSADILKGSQSLTEKLGSANGQMPQVIVPSGTTPLLQDNKLMVFAFKKEIAMVNVADGKVDWVEKLDPARIFFSDNQKTAFVVEHDKGGLVAQALATEKRMGKEVTAIDVATGKAIWKKPIEVDERIKWYNIDGDKLLIVHAKGCNFYNLEDGKKVWKDDYEAKRIAKLVENTEGYLVSFGYQKTMQLDKSGKKLWKKPQVAPSDIEDVDVDEDADFVTYKYDKGNLFLTVDKIKFTPKKNAGIKSYSFSVSPTDKMEFDGLNKTFLLYNNDGVVLINPDMYPKGHVTKKVKTDVKDIQFVEMRKNSYYFAGQEDFVIVKSEGDVTERHYKEPFDGKGFLAGSLSTAMSLGSVALDVSSRVNVMKGSTQVLGGLANGSEESLESGVKDMKKGVRQVQAANALSDASSFIPPARHSAFSQTQDFAYFFTKDKKSGEKVLVKLNKDTGEEMDKFILNDARPIYKVDEVENRVLYCFKKQLLVFEPQK